MLALPWWILGVNPDEVDDEPASAAEAVDEVEEAEEETDSSSILLYRTPSASPLCESIDQLPKVVDVSTFMSVAKRRSSSRMEEWISPKMRKTGERKSFVRNETEIMNKTVDGNSIEESDGMPVDSRSGSPMPNGDIFNETFFLDDNNNQMARSEQSSSEESPRPRDFPLFFTSFDDTTVLFNTTITGDIDLNQRNDAVGDWVFKNNKFLNPASPKTENSGSGDNVFKEPKKRGRKQKVHVSPNNKPSSSPAPIKVKEDKAVEKQQEEEPEVEEESKKTASKKKKVEPKKKEQEKKEEAHQEANELEEIPITPTRAPSLARRHTPSRKAKTYKSLRE